MMAACLRTSMYTAAQMKESGIPRRSLSFWNLELILVSVKAGIMNAIVFLVILFLSDWWPANSWIKWIVGPVVGILLLLFFLSATASYLIWPDADPQGVQHVVRNVAGAEPIREPEEDLLDHVERLLNREDIDREIGRAKLMQEADKSGAWDEIVERCVKGAKFEAEFSDKLENRHWTTNLERRLAHEARVLSYVMKGDREVFYDETIAILKKFRVIEA
jgi:hypothetical protein